MYLKDIWIFRDNQQKNHQLLLLHILLEVQAIPI